MSQALAKNFSDLKHVGSPIAQYSSLPAFVQSALGCFFDLVLKDGLPG